MSTFELVIKIGFVAFIVLGIATAVWAHIFEKDNKKETPKEGCSKFLISIAITIIAIFILSLLFNMCGGDNTPWSPRHT